jgi:hypothetical protein
VALLANAAECCAPHARLTTAFAPWRGARLFALLLLKHKRVPAVRARLRCIVNALPASANLTLARLLGARLFAVFFSKRTLRFFFLNTNAFPQCGHVCVALPTLCPQAQSFIPLLACLAPASLAS